MRLTDLFIRPFIGQPGTRESRWGFVSFGCLLIVIWTSVYIWELRQSGLPFSTLINVVAPYILGRGGGNLPLRLATYSFIHGCIMGLLTSVIALILLLRFAAPRLRLIEVLAIYGLGIAIPGLVFAFFFDDPLTGRTSYSATFPITTLLIALTVIDPKAPLFRVSLKDIGLGLLVLILLGLHAYNMPQFFFSWWGAIVIFLQLIVLALIVAGAPIVLLTTIWVLRPFVLHIVFLFVEMATLYPATLLVHSSLIIMGVLCGVTVRHIQKNSVGLDKANTTLIDADS